MKEEILINVQFTLFFEKLVTHPEKYWQKLNDHIEVIFDQTPIILPIPNETSLNEIPIVRMSSSNGQYSCNIARSRADFYLIGIGKQQYSEIKSDFLNKVEKFFDFFHDKQQVNRIAFISRFFIEDEKQAKTIAKLMHDDFRQLHHKDDSVEKIYEAFLRYVSRSKLEDYEINNFTTIERFWGKIIGIGDKIPGVLITRDFNTIPEKCSEYVGRFNKETIIKFIQTAETKSNLNEIKKLLWPIKK